MEIKYTKDDIYKLYFDDKLSSTEVAKKVGITRSGVTNYLRSRGFKLRSRGEATSLVDRKYGKQKDIDRNLVVKMYTEKNKSLKQIGDSVGLTASAVRSILITRHISIRSVDDGLSIRYPDGRLGVDAPNWKDGRSLK